jgi:hypothetical protein
MLALKGNYPFPDFSVKRDFASRPLPHFPGTHYSIIRNFSKSSGIFKGYGNKLPGKGNRFSSASNALNSWLVRFLYEMAGCLRSAVPLALRSKLIESIGRLPGLFEKLPSFQYSNIPIAERSGAKFCPFGNSGWTERTSNPED